MQTYLVVAHRTLVGKHLLDHVRSLSEGAGPGRAPSGPVQSTESGTHVRFYLVVPVRHPRDHAWTDGEVEATARARLDEGLAAFRNVGVEATGEVGDANPVYAVSTALRNRPFGDDDWDGIIVSTLPPGVSHWLGLDVVSRIKREFDIPVTHVVAPKVEADA
jgi:GABA permease